MEKMQQKTVVVLGDSFNNTLGLIRSLGQVGVKVVLILVGDDRLFVRKSKYVEATVNINALSECSALLQDPRLYGSFIICTNDRAAKWVDDNEEWLAEHYQTPMSGLHLGALFDKPHQCELAASFGLDVPQSVVYHKHDIFPDYLKFPVLMKPANSNEGEKSDIHICRNKNDLEGALNQTSSCHTFIIQEYIEKEFEINMIGVATDCGVFLPGGIKKLRHYPNLYSPCSYGIFLPDSDLAIDTKPIENMIKAIGYLGPFSVEFLRKGDKSYFMEVNFRHDGLAYTATAAGVNLLSMYVDGCKMPFSVKPTYMMDLSTDFCHVKDGCISKSRWFKDFIRTGCQLNFNMRDPMPTLSYYYHKIKQRFIGKI